MSDFGNPATPNYTAPDGLATLGNLMSLKQKQQGLQAQQLQMAGQQSQNQSLAAGATVDTQNAKEKMAGAQLLADPVGNGLVDAEGNPTKDAQTIIMKSMPTTGSEHYENIVKAAGSKVNFNNSINNLASNERKEIADTISGAASVPNANPLTIKAHLEGLVESKKGTPVYEDYKRIADISTGIVAGAAHAQQSRGQIIPAGQEAFRQAALGLGRTVLDASGVVGQGGVATQTPTPVQGKGGLNFVNTNPNAGPVGAPMGQPVTDQGISPTLATMPSGSLAVVGPNGPGGPPAAGPTPGGGSGRSMPPHPRTAADDAPPPNAPKQIQDAYQGAVQKANGHVDDVRTADESYGNNMSIANAIRQLSKGADTGPGTQTWNHVLGVLGADKANNAQELGAFLDRQAATVRGQMGLPGTNAGAEDSKSIVGNTNYNAKVIQDKNDYTQALTEGLHQYRNGLDRIAGFSGQASPAAVNAFKSAWTSNFDPNVFKGELAFKRSKKEGEEFVKSLDPAEAKSLAAKRAALQALAKGQLPQ